LQSHVFELKSVEAYSLLGSVELGCV